MEQVLLVIHVMIAAALIGMVLIQRSDTDGFGLSGGGSNLMSGRSAANLMTRTTAILAALFILNSLILSILASRHSHTSLVDALEQSQTLPVTIEKPVEPTIDAAAPAAETLQKEEKKPAAPKVPNADAVKSPAKKVKPAPAATGSDADATQD